MVGGGGQYRGCVNAKYPAVSGLNLGAQVDSVIPRDAKSWPNLTLTSDSTNSHFNLTNNCRSGGGTSGRPMAFCLGRLGSNPAADLGFFQFRIAVNLFSLGVRLFLIASNRTVHTLPSAFLFPIIIY